MNSVPILPVHRNIVGQLGGVQHRPVILVVQPRPQPRPRPRHRPRPRPTCKSRDGCKKLKRDRPDSRFCTLHECKVLRCRAHVVTITSAFGAGGIGVLSDKCALHMPFGWDGPCAYGQNCTRKNPVHFHNNTH